MAPQIEIVLNPVSGSKLAVSLVEKHIKHLLLSSLDNSDLSRIRVRQTESEGDGKRIGTAIAREHLAPVCTTRREPTVDIVVIGGDGTTHELLNGFFLEEGADDDSDSQGRGKALNVRLAIVPGGTANALYSAMYADAWTQEVQQQVATASSVDELGADVLEVMLRSVRSLASSLSSEATDAGEKLVPLPMMLNYFPKTQQTTISHLVTSHALHAAILHDADTPEMRSKHKGIERFKAAAQMNATRWTHGTLHLLPVSAPSGDGVVERYSPQTHRFEPAVESLELAGPFLYLNVMLTDRLESAFIPAPHSSGFSNLPPSTIDIVAIRPLRDPALPKDSTEEEQGVQFATTRLGEITAGMYNGGKHIALTYPDGEPVVEYFRCRMYDFVPKVKTAEAGVEEKAKLVCTDGVISSSSHTAGLRWEEGSKQHALRRGLKSPHVWR